MLVAGHKKHLEHCAGHKRKQASGRVEIEGLDELEAEEEERLASLTNDQDSERPVQVSM